MDADYWLATYSVHEKTIDIQDTIGRIDSCIMSI